MNYLIFTIIFIILGFDGLPFVKNSQWKELLLICSLLLLGIIHIILDAYNVRSPLMSIYDLIHESLKSIIKKGT